MTNTRMLQDPGYDGILFHYLAACEQASSPGPTVSGTENRRRACNYVSEIWILRWLPVSTDLSDFRRSVQSGNECKCKKKHNLKRAKGNDIITNVISANRQHSTLTFSIVKFQRCSSRFSFLFPPHRQGTPESLLTGNILNRMSFWKWCLKHWGGKHWQCLFFCMQNEMNRGHEKWSNLEQGS